MDRGAPALSQDELNQFCQRYGIKGGYISTSAKGDGLDELLEIVKAQIPWDDMTATVTTVTFKRIKDYVLSLKEKTDRKGVLVSPAGIAKTIGNCRRLPRTTREVSATTMGIHRRRNDDRRRASRHARLRHRPAQFRGRDRPSCSRPNCWSTSPRPSCCWRIKIRANWARSARRNSCKASIHFDELKGLEQREAQTLLDAAILRFLEHNICFRDTFNNDTLLIFPSLIKQKRPLQDDAPAADDISYVVRGRVENLYASLVVLLGYTPSFSRINQWQNQAQYEMDAGQVCGFRSIEEREGELELVLYYGDKMPRRDASNSRNSSSSSSTSVMWK